MNSYLPTITQLWTKLETNFIEKFYLLATVSYNNVKLTSAGLLFEHVNQ